MLLSGSGLGSTTIFLVPLNCPALLPYPGFPSYDMDDFGVLKLVVYESEARFLWIYLTKGEAEGAQTKETTRATSDAPLALLNLLEILKTNHTHRHDAGTISYLSRPCATHDTRLRFSFSLLLARFSLSRFSSVYLWFHGLAPGNGRDAYLHCIAWHGIAWLCRASLFGSAIHQSGDFSFRIPCMAWCGRVCACGSLIGHRD